MEKLWTVDEAAKFLGVDEADVEQLVRDGRLAGQTLGGEFVRFKPDDVKEVQASVKPRPNGAAVPAAAPMSGRERLADFLYFNDFYLLSGVLLAGLILYLIAAR